MKSLDKQAGQRQNIRYIAENFSPYASQNPKNDFDEDAAQERRRQERLKRKNEKRRETSTLEEGDAETLLVEAKKAKRKKKKKERPDLWVDDRYEDDLDEVFENNGRANTNLRVSDDWLGDWDE